MPCQCNRGHVTTSLHNLSILEAEWDISDKRRCRIAPKLDWLDKKASWRDEIGERGRRNLIAK